MNQEKEKKEETSVKAQSGKSKVTAKKPASPKRAAGEKQKPVRSKKERILRGAYLTLTIISAIIVAVYAFWTFFAAPPDVENPSRPGSDEVVTRPPVVTTYVDPDTGEEVEEVIPGLSADRKEEFYTFLLVGKSQETGGGLTDTMMLVAYDVPNQALSVMSLPRDTYVRYNGRTPMLNAVYNMAGGDRDNKGVEGLKRAVQDLTGVYPDFYITIQWEAFGELVDAIGGVYFEVPFDMYYNDLSQNFKINLKKGYQLLDGEGAMGVVRWRHNSDDSGHISSSYGYAEGDIGRIKTQQAFMKEVIKKCLQPDVVLKSLSKYITIFQKNVVTDLEAGHIAYFVQSAVGGLDMEGVKFATLPNYSAGNGHLLPSGSKIVQTVNDGFNPYKEDIRLGELTLATMDDVPKSSKAPEESETPGDDDDNADDSEEPKTSAKPAETETPDENDPLLPPGVTATPKPSASAKPSESGKPEESKKPSESKKPENSPNSDETAKPTDSPKSDHSAEPSESQSGDSTTSPAESKTPEQTPPPATPTPSEDEPLLPPGV